MASNPGRNNGTVYGASWVAGRGEAGVLATIRKYYYLGGRRIAMRVDGDENPANNGLFYFHSDHLGSTSVMSNESGAQYGDPVRYYPFGEQRSGDLANLPTDHGFTGHKHNDTLGLIYMNARFYVPGIGRFASADTIVPGAAEGSGGGLATIGYNGQMGLTPLTVGFHETQFLNTLNEENKELLEFGAPFSWDEEVRQEHLVPTGPLNPQALNRYSYCLNNPLRYVDPTGHDQVDFFEMQFSLDELANLITLIRDIKTANIGGAAILASTGIAACWLGFGVPTLLMELAAASMGLDAWQLECLEDYLGDSLALAEAEGRDTVTLEVYIDTGNSFWDRWAMFGFTIHDTERDASNWITSFAAFEAIYAMIFPEETRQALTID